MAKPSLYSYWRSSCSWRVRIALELKGIEYEYIPIHLVKDGGEQLQDKYAAINPMKAVPTFTDSNGFQISQSGAIIEYLEEVYQENFKLLPEAPTDRATIRKLCNTIGCDIQPVQNLRILKAVGAEKKMEWGKRWITEGFEALEKMLESCAGTYCFGDNVTMADLYLVPQVYNANRFSVEMSEFPIISRINSALQELPAFKKAEPSVMPDAQ